jgi:hypothetical protein
VDIDRDGIPLAVGGRELLQRRWDDLVPAFLGRERRDVAELASLRVVEREIAENLGRGRRVAGCYHRLQRRHGACAATASNGHILPDISFFDEVLLQHIQCSRLAA